MDLTTAKVVDGKPYLNKNPEVRKRWHQDIPGFTKEADAKWPTVSAVK